MKFEKVSYEQFEKDFKKFIETQVYDFVITEDMIHVFYNNIKLPKRSTKGSAGYDFITAFPFKVFTYQNVFVPSGIKVQLDPDKILMLAPRSSSAKQYIRLGNTIGIIDSDYYNNKDNEGHILICMRKSLRNIYKVSYEKGQSTVSVGDLDYSHVLYKEGEKIAQGIILPFFTADEEDVTATREGGFGSTGK